MYYCAPVKFLSDGVNIIVSDDDYKKYEIETYFVKNTNLEHRIKQTSFQID